MTEIPANTYAPLQHQLGLNRPLPYTPDWTAAADFLEEIAQHCLTTKPALILECSSGLSTLILARCCQMNKSGQVISLEDGAQFVAATQTTLNTFSVAASATLLHSPLCSTTIHDQDCLWYQPPKLHNKIDMLVIDGPSGFLQPLSRYPALPLLYEHLAEHCTIFLDDAARDDEQEIVRRWLATYPEFQYRYIPTERGCSILSR